MELCSGLCSVAKYLFTKQQFLPYLTYFSDGTLVNLVSPKSIVLSPEIVCKLFYQVCLAVKHLHQQSPPVIHRDLKVSERLVEMVFQLILTSFSGDFS